MTTDAEINVLALDPPVGTYWRGGKSRTAWLAHYLPPKLHTWYENRTGKLVVQMKQADLTVYRWAKWEEHFPIPLTDMARMAR